jgi:NAD(P)-dependent dehydrogenase (short-subunit alcohol dehydrogenase family)
MGSLDGQVALITGCSRLKGLGRGIALALASAGADVVVTDIVETGTRNASESGEVEAAASWRGLASLVEELESIGCRVLSLLGDVGNKDDAERMVAEAIQHFGAVDILVNNAGAPQGPDRDLIWKISEEAWDEVFRVNTKGAFLMSTAVVRHLIEREAPGRIINIASSAGKRGLAQRAAYSASKFAVIGLTQAMAQELIPHGITVNAVCPGAIDTARGASRKARPANESLAPPSTDFAGRIGQPTDVARIVEFLADPDSGFVTGQSIVVDGGLVMI